MPRLYGTLRPFRDEELKRIHDATLRILERVGIGVYSSKILERLESTEAKIDYDKKIAKFPSSMVEEAIYHCKNSADRQAPGENLVFSCDCCSRQLYNYATKARRTANLIDVADASRLADALENIDELGFPLEPQNVPRKLVDLYIWKTVWSNSDKTGGGGLSRNGNAYLNIYPEALDYLMKLAAVKAGGKKLKQKPLIGGFMGSSSPIRYDELVLNQMLKLVEERQYIGIGCNVVGGTQSPVTIAGLVTGIIQVTMENAEKLAGLTIVMNIDGDAHVYFANHPNYMDMVTGNVANGSVEHALAALLGQALIRYYGLQLFVSHPAITTGSNLPDVQAGMEKATQALMAGLGGAKGICGCGELNECFCPEQLVIDNEMAGLIKRYLRGVEIKEEDIFLDVIEEVGIGGNFLEHPTVATSARNTYWKPSIINRKAYASWSKEDGKETAERAHERVKEILRSHHPSYLSEDERKEMDEIIDEARVKLPEQE